MASEASGLDANEHTPLLGRAQQIHADAARNRNDRHPAAKNGDWQQLGVWLKDQLNVHVEKRILFAGFLITLSFSFTQVP